MKKKKKKVDDFYDYRNQSRWDRFRFSGRVVTFVYYWKIFWWKRLQGLINAITYPWWLICYWFELADTIIGNIFIFFRDVHTYPKLFYLWCTSTFKNAVKRVFRHHRYLRRRIWKRSLLTKTPFIFAWYLFLSFIDELMRSWYFYETTSVWWPAFFAIALNWFFVALWLHVFIIVVSLYFIGWVYWHKSFGFYYWWVVFDLIDLKAPDMAWESLFCFVQAYHLPTYMFCGWYSWVLNDLVDYYHQSKPLPRYKTYTWEYDHFKFRSLEATNIESKKKLEKTFQYIKLRDQHNRWYGLF